MAKARKDAAAGIQPVQKRPAAASKPVKASSASAKASTPGPQAAPAVAPEARAPATQTTEKAPPGSPEASIFVRPKPLSEVLIEAVAIDRDRVTVADLVSHLSSRGLAPLILLMGILNVVTIIPGSSTVMGLPLIFMGIAVILNSRRLWLPEWLAARSFDRVLLQRAVLRAVPYLQKIEKLARPRFWPRGGWILDRTYGIVVLGFSLMITLPIAFGNTMPAIAIILLSMGFAARDGLWVAAGLIAGSVALGILLGVAAAVTLAGASLFGW